MEPRMQALDPYLEIGSDDVRMIGIKGMGGAGKTTLACAIVDKISIYFEGRSFVENVRENSKAPLLGLKKLQEQVLTDVLKDKSISGNEATRCMRFENRDGIVLENLRYMKKLRCLIVENPSYPDISNEAFCVFPNSLQYIYWKKYPHWCLPTTFEANNLVTIDMSLSKIKQLWNEGRVMKKLKFLSIGRSELKSLDFGLMPNLERLNLESCHDLVELSVSGVCLKSLVYLNLCDCHMLQSLDLGLMPNLESNCPRLEIFMGRTVSKFNKHLLGSICKLKHLKTLFLHSCYEFHEMTYYYFDVTHELESSKKLDLSGCQNFRDIQSTICELEHLKDFLDLKCCRRLEKLPDGRFAVFESIKY
ncbi:hypothetical protein E3N88_19322 [Mikania micrantha]|uniref:NB-ARC domain-containing protein n=1 Tax=Mikania micrantha TaxID=192012 RepID=A0A5N6NMV0_9ASTR|nr:hypothetical protein E3N88_19322 [Mikania micrantha]